VKDGLGQVQSALVLGATSDIAAATLDELAGERLDKVVLAARDPERIAAGSLGEAEVATVQFDARDLGAHERFVEEAFERHGDFDLVLLAFGVLGSGAEQDRDAALATIQTNFVGAVSLIMPLVERLKSQGHGTLVVLSSVAAERGRKSNFVYGSSKAGLDAFCQGLADSLEGTGVHVMVVRPGFVRTSMTAGLDPAPLATTPQAVAREIVRGVRTGADTVWVPRPMRWVMSLLRHLPRAVFRRLDI
jgi:decaprenylphospho-beta-D-erythro-pentofuranosid-2-ulose 2-reductase